MFFKYYGVDWAIFVILVVHLWLLGNKLRVAFLFGVLGSSCGIAMGFLCDSLAIIVMNAVFVCMHIRAWWKWTPYQGPPRIAQDTWPEDQPCDLPRKSSPP